MKSIAESKNRKSRVLTYIARFRNIGSGSGSVGSITTGWTAPQALTNGKSTLMSSMIPISSASDSSLSHAELAVSVLTLWGRTGLFCLTHHGIPPMMCSPSFASSASDRRNPVMCTA